MIKNKIINVKNLNVFWNIELFTSTTIDKMLNKYKMNIRK